MLDWRGAATRASGGGARLGWISFAGLLGAADPQLRLRLFNGVASALLVIFNAAIALWPMVALNVTLTAINVFYIVRLLRGRHDSRTFEVVEISPNGAYLEHLLHEFDADIQHFNPGFSVTMPLAPSRLPHPQWSGDGGPGAGEKRRRRISAGRRQLRAGG
jgi:hypothetical protein